MIILFLPLSFDKCNVFVNGVFANSWRVLNVCFHSTDALQHMRSPHVYAHEMTFNWKISVQMYTSCSPNQADFCKQWKLVSKCFKSSAPTTLTDSQQLNAVTESCLCCTSVPFAIPPCVLMLCLLSLLNGGVTRHWGTVKIRCGVLASICGRGCCGSVPEGTQCNTQCRGCHSSKGRPPSVMTMSLY